MHKIPSAKACRQYNFSPTIFSSRLPHQQTDRQTVNICYAMKSTTNTHTRLTALFRDYPGEQVSER